MSKELNYQIKYGNKIIDKNSFLTPTEAINKPTINYNANINTLYTIIMYDPDSINGTFIHWIIINIPVNNINKGFELLPYKGPSPPNKTGIHRYIFDLFEQKNKIKSYQIENRNISLENIKKKLEIQTEPIASIQFTSEYKGGRNKKNTRKRNKNSRKRNKNTRKNNKII